MTLYLSSSVILIINYCENQAWPSGHSLIHTDKDIEEKALTALNSAQKKIKLEIHDLNEHLKASRENIGKLKEQIEQAEDDT